MQLQAIENHVVQRPGTVNGITKHYIPDTQKQAFWDAFYHAFTSTFKLTEPIEGFTEKINPYFGYFGFRWHPINFRPAYYHIGIDISETPGTAITTVYPGTLEYSGFANVNGNYIIVKHPEITTADGYMLQSLYMHCETLEVSFNLFQKISREYLSKNLALSNITIAQAQQIATVGTTGNNLGVVPHLHLQFEFVKATKHIAINPLKLYNQPIQQNLTAEIITEAGFKEFYQDKAEELQPWKKFWVQKI